MDSIKVAFVGPPGAGSRTHGRKVSNAFNLGNVVVDDLIHEEAKKSSVEGKAIAEAFGSGQDVPIDVVCKVISARVKEEDCSGGFVLVGYPRNKEDAQAMEQYGITFSAVLLLNCSEEECIARCGGRSFDPETGDTYHEVFRPAPSSVQERLVKRESDQPPAVAESFGRYESGKATLKDYLGDTAIAVSALKSLDEVQELVMAAVNDRLDQIGSGQQTDPSVNYRAKNVIVVGNPGSGKTSLCQRLAHSFGMVHVSAHDVLANKAKEGGAVGDKIKSALTAGANVDDNIVVETMSAHIDTLDFNAGILLEGFPVTSVQIDCLEAIGIVPEKVIILNVPETVGTKRCRTRLIDPATGEIYNEQSKPPPDGLDVIQSDYDTEQAIHGRVQNISTTLVKLSFEKLTLQLEGDRDMDEVYLEVSDFIQTYDPNAVVEAAPEIDVEEEEDTNPETRLKAIFDSLDVKGKEFLTFADLEKGGTRAYRELGITLPNKPFREMGLFETDDKGEAHITWSEFRDSILNNSAALCKDERLDEYKAIFLSVDKDMSGEITMVELLMALRDPESLLNKYFPDNGQDMLDLFNEMDADQSGSITWDEFRDSCERVFANNEQIPEAHATMAAMQKENVSLFTTESGEPINPSQAPLLPSLHEDAARSVILLGPPSSGKKSQAALITKKFGLVHLSTGTLLRHEVRSGTPFGMKIKDLIAQSKMVPDELMISFMRKRLSEIDVQDKGFLLDGFPANLTQAESLKKMGIFVDKLVVLDLPQRVIISRAVGRRMDPETGRVYHLTMDPPPEVIKDRLVQRKEDTEDYVLMKYEYYRENLESIKDCFQSVMQGFDASLSIKRIFSRIETFLLDNAKSASVGNQLQAIRRRPNKYAAKYTFKRKKPILKEKPLPDPDLTDAEGDAVFLGTDSRTRGNWEGRFGFSGGVFFHEMKLRIEKALLGPLDENGEVDVSRAKDITNDIQDRVDVKTQQLGITVLLALFESYKARADYAYLGITYSYGRYRNRSKVYSVNDTVSLPLDGENNPELRDGVIMEYPKVSEVNRLSFDNAYWPAETPNSKKCDTRALMMGFDEEKDGRCYRSARSLGCLTGTGSRTLTFKIRPEIPEYKVYAYFVDYQDQWKLSNARSQEVSGFVSVNPLDVPDKPDIVLETNTRVPTYQPHQGEFHNGVWCVWKCRNTAPFQLSLKGLGASQQFVLSAVMVDVAEPAAAVLVPENENRTMPLTVPGKTFMSIPSNSCDFTLTMWVKITETPTSVWRNLLSRGNSTDPRSTTIYLPPDSLALSLMRYGSSVYHLSKTELSTARFNHVGIVLDGVNVRLYVNGEQQLIGRMKDEPKSKEVDMVIGQDVPGVVEDCCYYNRALSPYEIIGIYEKNKETMDNKHNMQPVEKSMVETYRRECTRLLVHPNRAIIRILHQQQNSSNDEYDFSRNYLGDKGVLALIPALSLDESFVFLNLSNQGIKAPQTVYALANMLAMHPNIQSLDISHNKLGEMGGEALDKLLSENLNINNLKFKKNFIPDHISARIHNKLVLRQREMLAAAVKANEAEKAAEDAAAGNENAEPNTEKAAA